MPITISDKRRSEMYAAIHREITDLRLQLIREKHYQVHDCADGVIAQVEHRLYRAVLAAAEGRERP